MKPSMDRLASESKVIVAWLRDNGAATVHTLRRSLQGHDVFCSPTGMLRAASSDWWSRRLSNLVATGWLQASHDAQGTKTWQINPHARGGVSAARVTPAAVPAVSANLVLGLVPPRRINVMAGKYEPPPARPYRPGSLDFKAIPSRHCGEITDFKGGM